MKKERKKERKIKRDRYKIQMNESRAKNKEII